MNVDRLSRGLVACGAGTLAIAAYLPWIRPNPALSGRRDGVPDILLPKMNAGIEGISIVLLAVAVLALASSFALVRFDRPRTRTRARTQMQACAIGFAGLVALLLPVYYVFTTSLVGFDGTFVPTVSWYLTVVGGCVLVGAGVVTRLSQPLATDSAG